MSISPHPGGYLLDELVSRGLTVQDAAKGIGISRRLLEDIVWARAGISDKTASQIAEFLGTSAVLWLNLQKAFDYPKEDDDGTG